MRLGVDEVEVVCHRGGHFLIVVAVNLTEALGHAVAEAYGLHTLKAEAALLRHRTDGHFVEVFFGNLIRCHLQIQPPLLLFLYLICFLFLYRNEPKVQLLFQGSQHR